MEKPLQRHKGHVQARKCTNQRKKEQKLHLQPLPQRIRFGRAFRKASGVMFGQRLEEETRDIYNRFKFKKPIEMSSKDIENHGKETVCYVCKNEFTPENHRVKDHCHYTGVYRGAVHNTCNLKMKQPKFIPVLFPTSKGTMPIYSLKTLG